MLRLLTSAAAVAMISTSALAADLPMPAEAIPVAPMASGFDWTGFYVGVGGGYGWLDLDREIPGFANSYDADGFFAGGQVGYNQQWGWFVGGIEFDGNWAGIEGDDGGVGGTVDQSEIQWLASATLHLGLGWDRFNPYILGGGTAAGFEQSNTFGAGWSEDQTFFGWTVGGGVNVAVTDHLIIGAQYRFTDLEDENFTPDNGVAPFNLDPEDLHQVRGEVSWKF